MQHHDTRAWMLAEATELLERANRLQRQFFLIGPPGEPPHWEPPVDMVMNDHELGLLIALPGVAPDRFELTLEGPSLRVWGERSFGARLGPCAIVRMEIPYGRFERHIALPSGHYQLTDMLLEHGCLKITLERHT